MPADICCCCWLSLAKKRRNKKNTVFLPQCLYQGSSATGMWFFGRFVFFYFLFLRFSSSPQCLCQGSSATGMWFSGRFVIFFISCSSAFLLLRNVCVREIPRRVCVFWKVYNFFVFPFLSRSSASLLSCSSVFQPPFFVLFPLFLYFYIFLSMYKKNSFVVVLKTVSRLFNKRQRRFFLEYI